MNKKFNLLILSVFIALLCSCVSVSMKEPTNQDIHFFFAEVKKGNIDAVQPYLDAGMDIDVRNNEEFGAKTALIVAAKRMKPDMVEFLLNNGADPNAVDRNNNTAISEACKVNKKNSCAKIIEILIGDGAKIDSFQIEGENNYSKSPLLIALKYNNIGAAETLIINNAEIFGSGEKKSQDHTPLDMAIGNFQNDFAVKLISKGALNRKEAAIFAMLTAVKISNIDMIGVLIDNGFDVNTALDPSADSLGIAVLFENIPVVNYLIEKGAEVNSKNEEGDTPLHLASKYSKLKAAKILLLNGAKINARNFESQIPLMMANRQQIIMDSMISSIDFSLPPSNETEEEKQKRLKKKLYKRIKMTTRLDNTRILKWLIENGADVQGKDDFGKTVLMYMAEAGLINSCKELLAKKAKVNEKDEDGMTALIYAAKAGNKPIYDLLVKYGADTKIKTSEDEDADFEEIGLEMPRMLNMKMSNSALRLGGGRGEEEDGKFEEERIRLAELHRRLFKAVSEGDTVTVKTILKKKGVNINVDDSDRKKTPLIHAVENNHISTAELLIDHGADINKPGVFGVTPLFAAVKEDNKSMVEILLEHGANTFALNNYRGEKDEFKYTPFMEAVLNIGNYEIVELLLKHGADINADYNKDMTLLGAAAYGINAELLDLLLDNGADLSAEDDFTTSLVNVLTCKYDQVDYTVMNEGGMNLFHFAVMNGVLAFADQLLREEMDVNSQTLTGSNALMIVIVDIIENDDFTLLEWLIDKGIDVNVKNKKGLTCLDAADTIADEMKKRMPHLAGGNDPEIDKYLKKEISKIEKYKSIIRKAQKKNRVK